LANRTKLTPRARARFLDVLRATANVSNAARSIGMSRRGIYDARGRDLQFSAEWDDAVETAADTLEAEAWRRGAEGVEEPMVSMGKLVKDEAGNVLTIRKYSDHLLLALLKAHRPERYRENIRVDVAVNGLGDRMDRAMRYRETSGAPPIDVPTVPVSAIEDKSV
jgi:hypothetical protein